MVHIYYILYIYIYTHTHTHYIPYYKYMIYSIYYSIFIYTINIVGFPGGSEHEESACDMGDLGLIPGLGRSPWRREWLPTPVFWPGKFHGQRSLADCSPRGCKRLDTTE